MDDQPYIPTYTNGPEIGIPRSVQSVKLQSRMRRVHLQIKGSRFPGLLLVSGEFDEAIGEGVGDAELHYGSTATDVAIWFATAV